MLNKCLCILFLASLFLSVLADSDSFDPRPSLTVASGGRHLYDPVQRDEYYSLSALGALTNGTDLNAAQYLLDLHNSKACFDFCGGMMFQLVLSDALKEHLQDVAEKCSAGGAGEIGANMVQIFKNKKMQQIPDYDQSPFADNFVYFHGREVRKVPNAMGGMGFVLQLVLANGDDPHGWTANEIAEYNGWAHDGNRKWRKGQDFIDESGGKNDHHVKRFGRTAYGLHHRFYLHYGPNKYGHKKMNERVMWLSAEDGCEGTPVQV